jgi:hypothetical protein
MKLTTTITAIIALVIVPLAIASVFWADWIIKELFNKDINNWLILIGLCVIDLCIPRALTGLLTLSMIIASMYILFIR